MLHVSGYQLIEQLGEGGSATVWRAHRGGSQVAVKVAHAVTELAKRRFALEADALSRVGHPHVPHLFELTSSDDGRPVLVMELLEGPTLAAEMKKWRQPAPLREVAAVGDALLRALAVVHARALVHRDLKPSNAFLRLSLIDRPAGALDSVLWERGLGVAADLSRCVALTDFGLVGGVVADREAHGELTRAGAGVGTPRYAAPEQLRGEPGDLRSDLYSFGVLLYQMVTGELPFSGDADALIYGHLTLRPPLPSARVALPAPLESLILACLAKHPEQRPASADEVAAALASACDEALPHVKATRPRAAARNPRAARERQVVALLLADIAGDAMAGARVVARRRGFAIKQRGSLYLFGFSASTCERPVEAALAAADDLGAARALVDVATLLVREPESGPVLAHGVVLADLVGGLPERGVALTAAAAAAADPRASAGTDRSGGVAAPLRGRDPLLALAEESMERCAAERAPAFFAITGEAGLGKTALAASLCERARRQLPGAEIFMARASESGELALPHSFDELRQRARRQPVVLIIDDAHLAPLGALDLIEYAAIGGEPVALWVCLLARPRLLRVRPALGRRAAWHHHHALAPLAAADAVTLAAELLRPAEYPAASTLAALAQWSGGNPGHLVELCGALHREGYVRPRPQGESFYLATPDLDALLAAPVVQWLAARALADLPRELATLARLCACLGSPFACEQVAGVQGLLARAGAEGMADADAGVTELCERGVFAPALAGGHAFRSSSLEQGVYQLVDADERAAVHGAAAAFWRGASGPDALAHLARHAAATGQSAEAARAYLALAERALAEHRHADAERCADLCLRAGAGASSDPDARALVVRGEAYAYQHHIDRARADLGAAAAAARAAGDAALEVRALLAEAMALDWAGDFDAAAATTTRAGAAAPGDLDPALRARLLAARGRDHWRRGELDAAAAAFEQAAGSDDHAARVVALLLLPLVLVRKGELDAAAARFDQVIALCERERDPLHASAAFANRMFLWSARQDPEAARADLRRAMELARQCGNPATERIAAYNLAEDLHWSGAEEEALELARRARALQERYGAAPSSADAILLARIHAARGEHDLAAAAIAGVGAITPGDYLARAVELAAQPAGDPVWQALAAAAEPHLAGDEMLELTYLRALAAMRVEDLDGAAHAISEGETRLSSFPIWNGRFRRLEERFSLLRAKARRP